MYTITISNEKGGVAKTTTAVSVGASLAEMGFQVLVIDLDPQANLTLALGFEPRNDVPSISSAFLKGTPIDEITRPTSFPRLFMVPSNGELGLAERSLPTRRSHQHILRNLIGKMSQRYDYLILDCPPTLGVLTLNALVAANLLLIPTQAEFFSIHALRTLMAWIRQVRKQDNPPLTYRLLVTLYDRRNRTHRVLSEQLRQSFPTGMMETVIEVDTKLREAPIAGKPIIYHAPKSRASTQYRLLAQEIAEYVKAAAVHKA
jgi:chromosome partitioning protein